MLKTKKFVFIFLGVILLGACAGFAGGFYYKKTVIPERANFEGLAKVFDACNNLNQSFFDINGNSTDSLNYYSLLQDACNELKNPKGADFTLFWDTWNKIKTQYVGRADLNIQEMVYGAISGMVESLGDDYTVFFPPQETKRFKEDVKGSFEGVGMEIGVKKNQLQVISPLEGTPAQQAGLRAGDAILAIDGTSTAGMSAEEAAGLIRGPKGTQVALTILREDWSETKDFTITRDVIQIPSLKIEFKDLPNGEQAAYIVLYQFSEKAYSDFNNISVQILNSSARKIILDLRNNPGGYLEVAQGIAGWLLEKGDIVVIEDFGNGKENIEYKSKGPEVFADYPIVVLINGGSASAAEILAGALRDNRGVKLIGEKSFGKGSVQELLDLSDGSSIKITIAKWLTPKGNLINDIGLEPDFKVEITDDDIEQGNDPQLDKAVEIITDL